MFGTRETLPALKTAMLSSLRLCLGGLSFCDIHDGGRDDGLGGERLGAGKARLIRAVEARIKRQTSRGLNISGSGWSCEEQIRGSQVRSKVCRGSPWMKSGELGRRGGTRQYRHETPTTRSVLDICSKIRLRISLVFSWYICHCNEHLESPEYMYVYC
jgi:hypothetical protein